MGMVLPLIVASLGLWIALGLTSWWSWIGWTLFLAGGWVVASLLLHLRTPRVGHAADEVLFYLRSGPPIRVPIDVVEAFLMGQGPALLSPESEEKDQTKTIVVRLSPKHSEWEKVDVKAALAAWCDSYITIRGTWCEPLDIEVVKRLNRLHSEARRREVAQ